MGCNFECTEELTGLAASNVPHCQGLVDLVLAADLVLQNQCGAKAAAEVSHHPEQPFVIRLHEQQDSFYMLSAYEQGALVMRLCGLYPTTDSVLETDFDEEFCLRLVKAKQAHPEDSAVVDLVGADLLQDAEQMRMYGLDPQREEDQVAWIRTTPAAGRPVVDWERDAFEFGAGGQTQQPKV